MDSILEKETNVKLSIIWIQKVEYHNTKYINKYDDFVCYICLNQQPFNWSKYDNNHVPLC